MTREDRPNASLERVRGVVVTGSGGISDATARLLLHRGFRVHVISRRAGHTALLQNPPDGLTASIADLSDDGETERAFDEARVAMGEVDGLVAVAGGSARSLGDGPIDELMTPSLHRNIDLNLATTMNSLREFIRQGAATEEQEFRSAVLIGSALARHPASPLFVTHGYAAIKAGIEGLARSAAAHYASQQITVNVVAPGLTRTPMAERAQQNPVVAAYARSRQPLTDDGFIEPDDVAEACEWLMRARTVTGQVIYIDAGWSVYG
ncbi:SDR family NAD(P)-dependent oxidoreductase [Subtercola boreus]|nr:SDR family oxidoreductase [Subtercola boreus]